MKKFLSAALAGLMSVSLVACGSKTKEPAATGEPSGSSSDMKVAMITDFGDITDQSFNQTTYESSKAFCEENDLEFTYKKPATDADADRISSMQDAIDEGYNVIVMPGFAFASAITELSPENPDVKFVAIDVSQEDLDRSSGEKNWSSPNAYSAIYQEEIAGYMAGYAAVKLGYTKLGFLGGMAQPAVQRYGYGFIQGADEAAVEGDVKDVKINYVYGGDFKGNPDITARMDTWYSAGTEVVFACGGGIYTSAAEAAAKVDGKIIGVDVDQAPIIDDAYGEGMTITSAMKGLGETVTMILSEIKAGNWDKFGGKIENLGLVSENPSENYVQLAKTTQWDDKFTEDDYKALVAKIYNGEIKVSNDTTKMPETKVVKVDDQGTMK